MEQTKKYILIIIIVIGLILLAGCNLFRFDFFDASEEESNSVITLTPSEDSEDIASSKENVIPEESGSVDTNNSEDLTPTPSDIQPVKNIDLPLYTVNVDTSEIEALTALVPADTKITPELIVEKVVESMADRSIEVGIDRITIEGDTVIVSFLKDKAPLSEMGSGYEAAILDAIAQSLIDNLEDYNKVIYRAEGGAYSSGHFEFDLNDVYLEEN